MKIKTLIRLQITLSATLIGSIAWTLLSFGYWIFESTPFNWWSFGSFGLNCLLLGIVLFRFRR